MSYLYRRQDLLYTVQYRLQYQLIRIHLDQTYVGYKVTVYTTYILFVYY